MGVRFAAIGKDCVNWPGWSLASAQESPFFEVVLTTVTGSSLSRFDSVPPPWGENAEVDAPLRWSAGELIQPVQSMFHTRTTAEQAPPPNS